MNSESNQTEQVQITLKRHILFGENCDQLTPLGKSGILAYHGPLRVAPPNLGGAIAIDPFTYGVN